MSLPILCTHSLKVISIIVYTQTHGRIRSHSLSHDTLETLLLFFRPLVIVIIVGVLHSFPLSWTFLVSCFVEHHQPDNILTKVNEQNALTHFCYFIPFSFGFISDLGQIFYLIMLFTWMMCDLKASEKRQENTNTTERPKSLRFEFNESHIFKPKRNAGCVVVDTSTKHT